MKIKTSELTGAALDWAVAKAQNTPVSDSDLVELVITMDCYKTSTKWEYGGPIIEREGCFPSRYYGAAESRGKVYQALAYNGTNAYAQGPKPLTAAMRCYVASELGDEVEIPEELA